MSDLDQYSEKVVGFLDILGFRDLFYRGGASRNGVDLKLYEGIRSAFVEVADEAAKVSRVVSRTGVEAPVQVTYFSDSVILSCPRETAGAEHRVIDRCCRLARKLLLRQLACRGGIAYGATYHHQGLVFGLGVLDAYYLESKVANYPRIVVAEDVGLALRPTRSESGRHEPLVKAEGGIYYIDIFSSRHDKSDELEVLKQLAHSIAVGLWQARRTMRPDIIAKWMWLREECNRQLRRLKRATGVGPIPLIPAEGLDLGDTLRQ